ncbi:MAG: DMT family transporter [Comamonadaceae bacterium]|nr:MAG: DMT family transporter [Comamonadaceae bacterium]
MPHTPQDRSRLFILVAALTLVWGTNWVLFPLAVREVSIWTFRAICLLGSGSLVLIFARLRGMSLHVPRAERRTLVLAGLTYLVVWNLASTYAAVLLPSGQAAILGFTMPIWAVLLTWLFLRERPSARLMAGIVLAAAGVGLLAFAARNAFASAPLGFAAGLVAGLGWAGGTLILKRAGLTTPPIVSTGWQLIVAGVPIAAIALFKGAGHPFDVSWTSVLVMGYITIMPMALGNVLWFSIVNMLPASVSGLSAVMVPMVAMVTGALVRAEPLGVLELSAMACCGASMALVLIKRN